MCSAERRNANGYWLDPNGNPHNADFDPITDPAGVYTYTVGTACASASATATVTYLPAPDAGTNANLALCSNAVPANLLDVLGGTPNVGGSWTGPGGGPFSGTYDPATDAPGVYTYTVSAGAGCAGASATVTVTETVASVPGTNGSVSFCGNGGAQGLIAFLGGSPQVGGTWTAPGGGAFNGTYNPAVNVPGVYTYTVSGTAPCTNGTATVTVTENAMPVAGTNGAITGSATATRWRSAFWRNSAVRRVLAVRGPPRAGAVHGDVRPRRGRARCVYLHGYRYGSLRERGGNGNGHGEPLTQRRGQRIIERVQQRGHGEPYRSIDRAQSNGTWTAPWCGMAPTIPRSTFQGFMCTPFRV